MGIVSILISCLAMIVSAITAWLTLFRHGAIRMTQPTVVFFGPDGPDGGPKVFLRTLLYSTAKRGQIIENMFVKLRRAESVQNFNIWVYGDGPLSRGSGLFVAENGVVCNHHFLLPKDGTHFEFLAGDHIVETYASIVGRQEAVLLHKMHLTVNEQQATTMKHGNAGLYFDWSPDSKRYNPHLDNRPKLPSLGVSSDQPQDQMLEVLRGVLNTIPPKQGNEP